MIAIDRETPLAPKVTLRVGGSARYYCEPASSEELVESIHWAGERSLRTMILGKGSNIAVSDSGWNGLAINLSARFRQTVWDGGEAICQAGASLHGLAREAMRRGLGGCERLAGIPGTLGGGVVMNAGAFGQQVGDAVDWVEVCSLTTGERRTLDQSSLEFGYRCSAIRCEEDVVTTVRMRFAPAERDRLSRAAKEALSARRAKHPLDKPNCGSVFRNPARGPAAAALIEECALKGCRIGGAQVSAKHANFIVTSPGATAAQFRSLVAHVQRVVYERRSVCLTPEVRFVGEFQTPLFSPSDDARAGASARPRNVTRPGR